MLSTASLAFHMQRAGSSLAAVAGVQDSGSGLQQWQISAASSGYNIRIVKGREACAATTYLSVAGCSANPNSVLLGAATANAQWNVVAVNAAAG